MGIAFPFMAIMGYSSSLYGHNGVLQPGQLCRPTRAGVPVRRPLEHGPNGVCGGQKEVLVTMSCIPPQF